ncbi:hypothetical protein Glo7428_2288 [Gloeocapsa sp. PCC 7428]|uniref:DUF732 domain-containing protein n=1 Tax=Gloeocapsa sp. PCC 7428 TaxID=1173026 RepID=UPI0002A617D4|nr:DUF732 domain-containing protein [Gloeocapsa sp. PCC 7428]AFZ30802.1 hypothetical protein Glo7428_2288 [Gloeocapsa sp. PCC 7428]
MKILQFATISTAAISFLAGFAPAIAQDVDYVCYMTTKSGQVLDLSASVCQVNASTRLAKATSGVGGDRAFIADYKRTVMSYPQIGDKLLASIERSPESSIMQAKSICNELEIGLTLEDIVYHRTEGVTSTVDNVNSSVIASLATKHYCPQFSKP